MNLNIKNKLQKKIEKLLKNQFNLYIYKSTKKSFDNSEFKKIRKNIARIKTMISRKN